MRSTKGAPVIRLAARQYHALDQGEQHDGRGGDKKKEQVEWAHVWQFEF
jgi:hypothetical protein